jgi:hypothetical protein
MDPNRPWPPPMQPPMPPPMPSPRPARRWLPAAIIGAAIVIGAALVAGAVILKKDNVANGGPGTCEAWAETRLTLRSIPALPNGWNWKTPNITTLIKNQNAPVAKALDLFEPKIAAEPADVAQAAQQYVAARRTQIETLDDRSYTPEVGAAVDKALKRLNELCGIPADGRPI